ncbi:hypothetical protein [Jannaschia pohangensis]|uniref:Uncharacterized protein n=1 Tax=Jannaschia pohangensis TaxID=390807 RepID=A0A1I3P2N5_9RHOB|nr:hypothetical protein [Jannaschia pohangensis]SFJ15794.1 hypothetical protein SAMN04488095_2328 [Jannaschia pohangensis]
MHQPLGTVNHSAQVGQEPKFATEPLDLVAKITAPRPPTPRWVAFEVKSKMGPDVPFLSLSEAQQRSDYVQRAAEGAFAGIRQAERAKDAGMNRGRSWEGLIDQKMEIKEFMRAAQLRQVTKIHAKVELDRMGQPVGEIVTVDW